jgi:Trk K+ transport system NAD-binding subunit
MAVILTAAVAVKVLPSILFTFKWLGTRKATALGFLISNRVSLLVAASALAHEAHMISDEINAGLILTAVVTATICPVIYARLMGEYHTEQPRVFIIGAGRVGRALAKRLSLHSIPTFLIDNVPDQFAKLVSSPWLTTIAGDGRDPDTYKGHRPHTRDIVVAITGDDETNFEVATMAKQQFECSRVIARDNNPDNSARFRSMGIIPMRLKDSAALTLENMIMRPTIINLLTDAIGQREPVELTVRNPALDGMPIRDLKNKGDALFIVIRRGEEFVIPHGNEHLRLNDQVLMLCTETEMNRMEQEFSDLAVHGHYG